MNKDAVQKMLDGITQSMTLQQQLATLRLIEQEAFMRAQYTSQLMWDQTSG